MASVDSSILGFVKIDCYRVVLLGWEVRSLQTRSYKGAKKCDTLGRKQDLAVIDR